MNLENATESIYWNKKSRFIFIAPHIERKRLYGIFKFFHSHGILDAIIIGHSGENVVIYSFNPFEHGSANKFYKIENDTSIDGFYPDKLKDLKGYRYRAVFFHEYPSIFISKVTNTKTTINGISYNFLKTVAFNQNASVGLKFVEKKTDEKNILSYFSREITDLSLNTALVINKTGFQNVNTYEPNGYCILLPYPERKSFFHYVLTPFDLWTWILIMLSIAGMVTVWYFLNKHTTQPNPNSTVYFFFAVIAFFLGQGLEFRQHRLMQKVLIQLMIMMTFILGNAYQSVLISLMSESRYGDKITSIQGVVDSNYTFLVDSPFMQMFKSSEQYQKLGRKINITNTVSKLDFKQLSSNNVGLILTCSTIDNLYKDIKNEKRIQSAIDYYYKLPEKFYTFYKKFPTTSDSMFADRLEEYSLRVHEAGLKQHWKTLISFEDTADIKQRQSDANEEYLLNFKDMAGAFYCLAIGHTLAFIAFLFELFHGNLMEYFIWKAIKKYIRRRFNRFRRNRVAPHRFVHVQPRLIIPEFSL